MKPTKTSHIEFCQAVADGMTQELAYKTYVSVKKSLSSESAQVIGSNLASKYFTHIQKLKENIGTAISEAHKNSALNRVYEGIMDKAERMSMLSEIAYGRLMIKKALMTNQRTEIVEVEPELTERIRAVAELNKMDGSYAPFKNANTNKDGEDIETISEQDVERIINEIRANKSQ